MGRNDARMCGAGRLVSSPLTPVVCTALALDLLRCLRSASPPRPLVCRRWLSRRPVHFHCRSVSPHGCCLRRSRRSTLPLHHPPMPHTNHSPPPPPPNRPRRPPPLRPLPSRRQTRLKLIHLVMINKPLLRTFSCHSRLCRQSLPRPPLPPRPPPQIRMRRPLVRISTLVAGVFASCSM